ncbi:hypothetical protein [Hyphomicrobium sp.]|uniref:porin n=1 Tax=Hyphomicrobium sp. TaxID=82 RepID=UPI002C5A75C2|nr:hypothetical protein [Hyphomicrobium sp.]HRN88610.1 hypothetical protein [Hyphomicrobium sp.]HRQ25740.1 hypothetical protein [Hyphomicrobium sp.]
MTGGFMTSAGRLSLFAAASLLMLGGTSAGAADLGGNCCADLEERIAELEATTARKGNRKVSLEVGGQVNQAVLFWDDGFESNAGVYTNDASRSRFRFRGDAKINSDLKAGYLLEIGVRSANSKRFNQDDHSGTGLGMDLRHSTWYIDSKSYGRVWMGLTGGASESITEINLAGTGDVAKFSDAEDMGGDLALRRADGRYSNGALTAAGALSIRRLIRGGSGNQPGEGRRYDMVRYDTPEIFGFTGTVNWGADDTWEMGLRYKGEFGGFKLAAGIAYGESSESAGTVGFECTSNVPLAATGHDARCNQLGGSASVMHVASGLYANFAAGYMEDEQIRFNPRFAGQNIDDRQEFWALEAGIQQKWFPLGKTTLFGQYYDHTGGASDQAFGDGGRLLRSNLDIYSLGIMQDIDAAAMKLYAIYRHVEADATSTTGTQLSFEDVDMFMTGAVIKF